MKLQCKNLQCQKTYELAGWPISMQITWDQFKFCSSACQNEAEHYWETTDLVSGDVQLVESIGGPNG